MAVLNDLTNHGYQIVYADPPWQYGSRGPRGGKFAKLDYSTMTVGDLKNMPVNTITAPDAVCFMWTTCTFMKDAIEVLESWGFTFKRVDKVWAKKTKNNKPHAVCGPWGMTDCEILILGVKGSPHKLQTNGTYRTLVELQYPGRHSKKPEWFYEMIENRFIPTLKLELFARNTRKNWDSWGNEL